MIFIPSLCAAKLSSFIIGWGPVTSLHRFIIIYPRFYCKVDMKCMVSYIQWYHEMNNGKKHRKKIYSMNELRRDGFIEMFQEVWDCWGQVLVPGRPTDTMSTGYLSSSFQQNIHRLSDSSEPTQSAVQGLSRITKLSLLQKR